MALTNLWGSYFSRIDGVAMKKPLRRGLFNRVSLHVGEPIASEDVRMDDLKQKIQALLAND